MGQFTQLTVSSPPVQPDDENGPYLNYYEHCGSQWQNRWSCMCNDRCPVCNAEIEPYKSDELDEQGNVIGVIDHTAIG